MPSMRCWRCRPRKLRNPESGQRGGAGRQSLPIKILGRIAMPAAARLMALGAVLGLALASPAHAQYPNRPVSIIVSLAAGSGMDVLTRLYADKLQASLGKPFIVENRPGASLML